MNRARPDDLDNHLGCEPDFSGPGVFLNSVHRANGISLGYIPVEFLFSKPDAERYYVP